MLALTTTSKSFLNNDQFNLWSRVGNLYCLLLDTKLFLISYAHLVEIENLGMTVKKYND